jgi:hypothetical protein
MTLEKCFGKAKWKGKHILMDVYGFLWMLMDVDGC